MNTTFVSVHDFVGLFPKFSRTVSNFFNRRGAKLITGEAEILKEDLKVFYIYEVSTGLLTILRNGNVLHKETVCTTKEILSAFRTAEGNFFILDSQTIDPEIVPFPETEKGKRILEHSTSKKAIKVNQRGQKDRWNERRAMRTGTKYPYNSYRGMPIGHEIINNNKRFRGKPLRTVIAEELERNDFVEFSVNEYNRHHSSKSSQYSFLTKGMNVIIERDGTVGAISFNHHYLGHRVVRMN